MIDLVNQFGQLDFSKSAIAISQMDTEDERRFAVSLPSAKNWGHS